MPAATVRRPTGALPGALACVALLTMDAGPSSAACPAGCAAPASWGQPFSFAGLTWERKSGCGGPGPNCWDAANAEPVPGEGVCLRLTRRQGKWYSAEIRTAAPVPTGTYSAYLVGRTDLLDPNVVLGVFLYDDAAGEAGDPCPAELDVESSRFGDPLAPNAHFVTYTPGACGPADLGQFTYTLGGTHTTHQLEWSAGAVTQRLLHGHRCVAEAPQYLIGERTFVSPSVPAAGGMRLHLNLWAFAGNAPGDGQEVEITVRDVVQTCGAVADAGPPPPPSLDLAVRTLPARGSADLRFTLAAAGPARVTVADVTGRHVATLADGTFAAGGHALRWAPAAAPPGVYFVRLEAGGRAVARRVLLLD